MLRIVFRTVRPSVRSSATSPLVRCCLLHAGTAAPTVRRAFTQFSPANRSPFAVRRFASAFTAPKKAPKSDADLMSAFAEAMRLHETGDLPAAYRLYTRVLERSAIAGSGGAGFSKTARECAQLHRAAALVDMANDSGALRSIGVKSVESCLRRVIDESEAVRLAGGPYSHDARALKLNTFMQLTSITPPTADSDAKNAEFVLNEFNNFYASLKQAQTAPQLIAAGGSGSASGGSEGSGSAFTLPDPGRISVHLKNVLSGRMQCFFHAEQYDLAIRDGRELIQILTAPIASAAATPSAPTSTHRPGKRSAAAREANAAAAAAERESKSAVSDSLVLDTTTLSADADDSVAQHRIELQALTHWVIGQCYARSDRPEPAIVEFDAAIRVQPNEFDSHLARGKCFRVMAERLQTMSQTPDPAPAEIKLLNEAVRSFTAAAQHVKTSKYVDGNAVSGDGSPQPNAAAAPGAGSSTGSGGGGTTVVDMLWNAEKEEASADANASLHATGQWSSAVTAGATPYPLAAAPALNGLTFCLLRLGAAEEKTAAANATAAGAAPSDDSKSVGSALLREAVEWGRSSVVSDPNFADNHHILMMALNRCKRYDDAIELATDSIKHFQSVRDQSPVPTAAAGAGGSSDGAGDAIAQLLMTRASAHRHLKQLERAHADVTAAHSAAEDKDLQGLVLAMLKDLEDEPALASKFKGTNPNRPTGGAAFAGSYSVGGSGGGGPKPHVPPQPPSTPPPPPPRTSPHPPNRSRRQERK